MVLQDQWPLNPHVWQTKGLFIGKRFGVTPPEIRFWTFWWYPLKPEVGFSKWVKPEMGIWIDIPRFSSICNRSPFGHCPITCQYCKINILWLTGPAGIVRGKLFRSVTVKTVGISRRFEVQRIWFVRFCGFGIDIIWFGSWNVFQIRNLVKLQEIF